MKEPIKPYIIKWRIKSDPIQAEQQSASARRYTENEIDGWVDYMNRNYPENQYFKVKISQ